MKLPFFIWILINELKKVNGWKTVFCSYEFFKDSKSYFEIEINQGKYMHVGVINTSHSDPNQYLSECNKGWGYIIENGKIYSKIY